MTINESKASARLTPRFWRPKHLKQLWPSLYFYPRALCPVGKQTFSPGPESGAGCRDRATVVGHPGVLVPVPCGFGSESSLASSDPTRFRGIYPPPWDDLLVSTNCLLW
ncbi:hypothetical protein An07g01300 [Aspergillus niger]|uniref:Uncharacterized protein n=2 Tax=Aspergillus niger TaxID=5061 RepID=A2QM96_ASPNC|nr:hypothetical protein An07g01300 [Aspergillus niger]CAK96577.1 hypothetical protein An07g01300 [Aspergillus niger]